MRIDDFEISDASDCYVIAEIGHNHQGSIENAKKLFDEAKAAGAHAVKLQKRDNRSLYTHDLFNKPYENENSYGATYGEHREHLEFERAEYEELQAYADEIGITFFATAFDMRSADFLARARDAGLQDRVRRPDQHAAAAPRRVNRQADDPLHAAARRSTTSAAATTPLPRSTQRSRCCSARPATRSSGRSSTCA